MSVLFTIGQLAARCGVSRTTVLYYEQAGLVAPAARTAAGYRQYSQADVARVRQVRAYRATGLALDAILRLLDGGDRKDAIAARLEAIGVEMAQLREQQAVLVRLLGGGGVAGPAMDKEAWTAMLREAGLDDAAMRRWHRVFERQNPQAHEAFLRSLGMEGEDVERVRRDSGMAAKG